MLNRRILRIKAFKVLYSNALSCNMSLEQAKTELLNSCEATRDLYVFLLGMVAPLTHCAAEKIEMARAKFNPTEEEKNPNLKFVNNSLSAILESDPDFKKAFSKRKFSWDSYDLILKNIYASLSEKEYFRKYMEDGESSLSADCKLFTKIYEEELSDCETLRQLVEEKSIYWIDDLEYALSWCCKTFKTIAKEGRWSLLPLYQSELLSGPEVEDDKAFVLKLLQAGYFGLQKYSDVIASSVSSWEKDRLFMSDVVLISMGLSEAVAFPQIPLKVTINEYVEIAKFFGTPKSSSFVNGLLDKTLQKMVASGEVVKTGKGLC